MKNELAGPGTPFIVLSGVTVFVAVIVAWLLVIAFTAYYLSK
ncbi:MAG: hypothetical protein WAU41_00735 [Gaiellaceae bacterium]